MQMLLTSGYATEFFLLVAIHFHTKKSNTTPIIEFIRATLRLHMIVHTESLNLIGQIITNDVFIEENVGKRALELSPTPSVKNLIISKITFIITNN